MFAARFGSAHRLRRLARSHSAPSTSRAFFAHGVVLATALALGAGIVEAQQGVGAKYGTRDPHTCQNATAPTSGAPSPTLAAQYVVCGRERETNGNTLWLLENVRVQVGKGTPYRDIPQIHRPGNVDPDGSVYAIRGAYRMYMCGVVQNNIVTKNAGKNCRVYDVTRATGTCYKTTFGDWSCSLIDDNSAGYGIADQPPPRS